MDMAFYGTLRRDTLCRGENDDSHVESAHTRNMRAGLLYVVHGASNNFPNLGGKT